MNTTDMPTISYKTYRISKGNGKFRVITAPNPELKSLQKKIMNDLEQFQIHDSAHGFIKGKSIATNALPHIKKKFVLNIDLKDFFPSIKTNMVKSLFKQIGYDESMTDYVVYMGGLPQGSPCSPVISNLYCIQLDEELKELADSFDYSYTRYADDLTFSGQEYSSGFIKKVYAIVKSHNLIVNYSKTKIKWRNQRQSVTGIVVNEKLNIPVELRKKVRAMNHQFDKLDKASRYYLSGMKGFKTVLDIK